MTTPWQPRMAMLENQENNSMEVTALCTPCSEQDIQADIALSFDPITLNCQNLL